VQGMSQGTRLAIDYTAGYFVYLITTAIWAWETAPTFLEWWTRLAYQVTFAVAWPVLVIVHLFGVRW
jgi:hypothetical protein